MIFCHDIKSSMSVLLFFTEQERFLGLLPEGLLPPFYLFSWLAPSFYSAQAVPCPGSLLSSVSSCLSFRLNSYYAALIRKPGLSLLQAAAQIWCLSLICSTLTRKRSSLKQLKVLPLLVCTSIRKEQSKHMCPMPAVMKLFLRVD